MRSILRSIDYCQTVLPNEWPCQHFCMPSQGWLARAVHPVMPLRSVYAAVPHNTSNMASHVTRGPVGGIQSLHQVAPWSSLLQPSPARNSHERLRHQQLGQPAHEVGFLCGKVAHPRGRRLKAPMCWVHRPSRCAACHTWEAWGVGRTGDA